MSVAALALCPAGAALLGASLWRLHRRLALSRAKHPSLAGHPRNAKRIASRLPFYEPAPEQVFALDDVAPDVVARRRAGFDRLAALYEARFPKSRALTEEAKAGLADLQFTSRYRVPFQFARLVGQRLGTGVFVEGSSGLTVTDCDGNHFYDLTGSYGLTLLGTDAYKACIREGVARVEALGPVLGQYHPVVAENVRRLRAISGLDQVSFHMSGTEAVMQAVRLARYHTGRSHLVRFCGAYHGWWGEVQPGIGNPRPADETYTLAEMSDRALHVLRTRRNIACVLVNPLQALHPNGSAPADSALADSGRRAGFDREAYTAWLQALRAVCTERGIVLILDEVFVGFRLAPGGAQQYFGVRADLVVYGKTLGGGLPVGVLCGRADLMQRFREDRPGDICFARGTFSAHPYVMGAMAAFLDRMEEPSAATLYATLDETWNGRAAGLNARLAAEGLPVRVANLSTIWTVLYGRPGRYNWMFQYYLRAEGLALSWVGTGRLIFPLRVDDADFEAIASRFVLAARAMAADGWFECGLATDKAIRRRILGEMIGAWLKRWRPVRHREAFRTASSASTSSLSP